MKRVRLPLDHLAELWPNDMKGARVGALLRPASVSASLRHTSQILEELSGQLFRLAAFFGPQHGFLGQTQDNMIEWTSYCHPRLGIPIYSLYSERHLHRNPFLHQQNKLRIQSETVKSPIRSEEWIVIDSGPAVHRLQIDLYWGEDEPRGAAGRQPARPAGTWMEYAFETSVTVKR